jgi:hypothetical protein
LLDASLLDFAGVALVSGADEAAGTDLEAMSRGALEMERIRLIDSRRSLAPGVALLAVGGGVALFSLLFALAAASIAEFEVMAAFLVIGGVMLGAAAVGVVLLVVAMSANSASAARIRAIDDRIQRLGSTTEQPPPPPNQPPPPPPPPSSGRDVPPSSLLLATF